MVCDEVEQTRATAIEYIDGLCDECIYKIREQTTHSWLDDYYFRLIISLIGGVIGAWSYLAIIN